MAGGYLGISNRINIILFILKTGIIFVTKKDVY